jgi:hypothetical protein
MVCRNRVSPDRPSKGYLAAIALAHEHAGFDRALIGYFSVGAAVGQN